MSSKILYTIWHNCFKCLDTLQTRLLPYLFHYHYSEVILKAMASQITSHTSVYSTIYSRRKSKKTSKLRVAGFCKGNSPVTGEFPTQMASNAENAFIWWRHRDGVDFSVHSMVPMIAWTHWKDVEACKSQHLRSPMSVFAINLYFKSVGQWNQYLRPHQMPH